ncbi:MULTISPECIES: hypothetical protein [unclassified Bradyrhizobium]|uniref:hypothetical protein n=1 Tax=Bradyrhizobium sp. USDA 4541 TaxID=2817704 RepID=UPI0020A384B5|nr:hypothetical protein [Bradyrhizobium sp. USDA 4541]MCP1852611.1 hypothetical protein [Bradyrhizobium sp. USDA 4541]
MVNSIRKIGNTEYFAIQADGQDDWIMRPALGQRPARNAGLLLDGIAWFFNTDAGSSMISRVANSSIGCKRPGRAATTERTRATVI